VDKIAYNKIMYKTPQNIADITRAVYGNSNVELKLEYVSVFLLDLLDKLQKTTSSNTSDLQSIIEKTITDLRQSNEVSYSDVNAQLSSIFGQLEGINSLSEELQASIEEVKQRYITHTLSDNDKNDIAKLVEIPVQEKIIEKTETIIEQPIVTNEIVEKAMYETPEAIRDKLESIKVEDDKLDKSAIKGLEDELRSLESKVNSKSSVRGIVNTRPLTGTLDITNDGSKITRISWQHGTIDLAYSGFKLVSATGSGIYGNSSFTYSGNWLTSATIS
jgi:hypothetical protein